MMTRELVAELLRLKPPWQVKEVVARPEAVEVVIEVECGDEGLVCPECGARSPLHDERRRRFQHLDFMEYRTIVRVKRPRIRCAEHGIRPVPARLPAFTPPAYPTRVRIADRRD